MRSNTPEIQTRNQISRLDKERYKSGIPASSFYCSSHLKKRLIKEGQCFKCGKQSHWFTDPDAQCQSQSTILDEKLSLNIKKMKKKISSQSDLER